MSGIMRSDPKSYQQSGWNTIKHGQHTISPPEDVLQIVVRTSWDGYGKECLVRNAEHLCGVCNIFCACAHNMDNGLDHGLDHGPRTGMWTHF
jgi:hypothetical protein